MKQRSALAGCGICVAGVASQQREIVLIRYQLCRLQATQPGHLEPCAQARHREPAGSKAASAFACGCRRWIGLVRAELRLC